MLILNAEVPLELKVCRVFRFTIRELLWLTLTVAIATGWWTESFRSRQWRQRAEIAVGQLEVENLGQMVFTDKGVSFKSLHYDVPSSETFIPTDSGR
jgi:hypothetical protein